MKLDSTTSLFTFFHPSDSCNNTTIGVSLLLSCQFDSSTVLFWMNLSKCFTEAQLEILLRKNTSLACHEQSLGPSSIFLTYLHAIDKCFHHSLF